MKRSSLARCLLLVGLVSTAAAQADLYRYVDDRGITVLNRLGVPPEYVGKGYEVLNEQGRVMKVVPPAPTAAERERRQADALQAKSDRRLLRLYSSVADVDRARDRKLAELDSLISVTQGNVQAVRLQQDSVLSQAAEFERTGRKVPESLVTQIDNLGDEQRRLAKDVERYRDARAQAEKAFAADRARVGTLVGESR